MGRICKILTQVGGYIKMKDNYLRVGDVVDDEKGIRYIVVECEEKEEEITIDNNHPDKLRACPDMPRVHVRNTTRKVKRAIIKLNEPLKNGKTLQHKMCAFFEKD